MQDDPSRSALEQDLIQFLYRSPVGLIDADSDGRIALMTPMAAQLLLPLCGTAALDNLFDALERPLPRLRAIAAASGKAKGAVCVALRFPGVAGPGGEMSILSLSLFRADGGRLTAVLHDATREERRQRRRVEAAAYTDGLTGLPNRQAVQEHLGLLLSQSGTSAPLYAVIFLNCDRFQHINDSEGHTAGDALLGLIAGRLREVCDAAPAMQEETAPAGLEPTAAGARPLVGRVGGDEFAVIAELGDAATDLQALLTRLVSALEQPYVLGGRSTRCRFSVGVALAVAGEETPGRCLYHARLAMTEAKREGGARTRLFDTLMLQRTHRRTSLENDLRRAIGTSELHVVYQPVVRLADGRVEAVEALVRWQHPLHGALSPVEFIGIAEDSGLIGALGSFVLATACRQFAQWRRKYPTTGPGLLAVNLSRGQLPQPSLVADIEDVLRATGMAAESLQLEVTESLAAQDEAVQMRLHELKRLGLTLALDDFGTGYSSLASLYQLPVDLLKIDRSFVSQLETSAHHRVLAEATIKVAKSLNFRTVAEGIETVGQAEILRAMQCDKGQGYLFARPLKAPEFEAWLERQSPDDM
ncbi:MAG: bifunctional diguanylate cyclase/phosphodiesterase [Pseudorhodoferax sp.]